MTTARKATDILAEQAAAAEVEGIFEPTGAQMALIHRLRDLTKREREIKVESDAIKASLIKDMAEVGARALAHNGKSLVLIVDKTKDEVYLDQLELAEPDVVEQYRIAKARFDAAAERFTFRVPATPAKTFPGVR